MPTYEYECLECSHRFDVFQSMKDEPIKTCVKCGGNVKKLIGAGAGIIFKGSGFYVNDYKNGTSKKQPACKSEKTCAEKSSAGDCSCPAGSCTE
jgi:putative FmdB family regulatory protein